MSDLDITENDKCMLCIHFLESKILSMKILCKLSESKFEKALESAGITDIALEEALKHIHRMSVEELIVAAPPYPPPPPSSGTSVLNSSSMQQGDEPLLQDGGLSQHQAELS